MVPAVPIVPIVKTIGLTTEFQNYGALRRRIAVFRKFGTTGTIGTTGTKFFIT
jgi:hypothetical protein